MQLNTVRGSAPGCVSRIRGKFGANPSQPSLPLQSEYPPSALRGEIVVVEPIAIAGGNYASFLDGRGLMTVEADYTKKCQSFSTELTALCVPNLPQYMWYIFPNA